jgi:hypothetical protein
LSSTEVDATNAYSFLFPLGTQPSPIRTSQAMFVELGLLNILVVQRRGRIFAKVECIVKFPWTLLAEQKSVPLKFMALYYDLPVLKCTNWYFFCLRLLKTSLMRLLSFEKELNVHNAAY